MRVSKMVVAVSVMCALGLPPLAAAQPTPVLVEPSAKIPLEVDIPGGFGGNPIDFFDDYSWRIFLALNWPAVPGSRGKPDMAKNLSDVGAPRVWETWKADYEIFQPGGMVPTKWSSLDAVTPCPEVPATGSGNERILGSFSQFGDLNQAAFGEAGNPLVAQNRTYARYEIRVNEAEYDFIVSRKYYLAESLPKPDPAQPAEPFTNGSIELKAAWKELKTPEEIAAAAGKYYTVVSKVMGPKAGKPCESATLALVGFHIVQKTPKRPQWVWSSFEHVDNIPEGAPPAGKKFSFNDGTKPQKLDPEFAPLPLSADNPQQDDPTPMQVVRGLPTHPQTTATNAKYQAKLAGTVWANYQLVMTQWPTEVNPPDGPGAPFPGDDDTTCTANSVMETYFQDSTTSSCMACHDKARSAKLDFVWFVKLRAFSKDPGANDADVKRLMDSLERLKPEEHRDPKRLMPN